MVLLDSDLLIAFTRGEPTAISKMTELKKLGARLTTTPINAYELYHGAYTSTRRDKNLSTVKELLTMIERLPLDDKSCEEAGRIVSELEAQGTPIGALDTIIAGAALRHGETLITRNLTHFERVQGLQIETW
jgi:predicted nucleic acid-binding protein